MIAVGWREDKAMKAAGGKEVQQVVFYMENSLKVNTEI